MRGVLKLGVAVVATAIASLTAANTGTETSAGRTASGRRHVIVESIPDAGRLVERLPDGRWIAAVPHEAAGHLSVPQPESKSSVDYAESAIPVVVSFYRDVSAADADAVLAQSGVERRHHPDLLPSERLIEADAGQIVLLTESDEVAHVYPASKELAEGSQLRGCAGQHSGGTGAGLYVSSDGHGWDGAGTGCADLTWSLQSGGSTLPADTVSATIGKALAEWAKHACLQFRRTDVESRWRNLAFSFTRGEHLDPYPFDGRAGMLAHAFYPAGVNPEPIAGDVHLDDDETWTIDGDPDLYSVLLHEAGHALGLGHSDRPGAVMYPYQRKLTTLQPDDIAGLQRLYRAPDVQPLSITFDAPSVTSQSAIQISGVVTGGRGDVAVTWSSALGGGTADRGRQWRTPVISLMSGVNRIVITATDASGAAVSREAVVTMSAAGPQQHVPSVTDRVNPTVTITWPSGVVYGTSAAKVRIRGTARDNVALREVTWQCGSLSGSATGTSAWSFELPLLVGDNHVVLRARDHAGNTGSRSLLVTRR